ncbi:MAG TPA: phage major capsid protein [Clostridium perfringens]|nr:phage major capsid protein [Clostridium perfringens]
MSLEVIKKMLEKRESLRKDLDKRAEACEDVVELRSIITKAKEVDEEIADLRSTIASFEDNEPVTRGATTEPVGGFNPIATYRNINSVNSTDDEEDKYSTLAYRKAFKDYVISGVPIPEEYTQEQRDNQLTMVGDVGAVIPTNLLNKVIEDMTVESKILARITQTSMQGGVDIPISDLNPTATWLESENAVSDTQKAEMKAKLSFGYHVLEARISVGLLTNTVTLNVFENTIVKQLKKAMIRAIETAIISGTGVGQPRGITTYTLPSEQVVKMDTNSIGKVSTWAGVESKIPESEEDSVIYMMNKATWEKYLNGMTDSTGQKIGLGRINEKGQKILNGREVLTCDKLPSFDSASDNDIFGVVVDLSKYMLNSNLSMYYKKYFNEDTNKYVHKSLMIVDGKMAIGEINSLGRSKKLVGANGLIYLTKGTE